MDIKPQLSEVLSVADCMRTNFLKLNGNMPAVEAAALLVDNEFIGAPVIDDSGKLQGWVSEQDLLKPVMQVFYFSERVATVATVMHSEVLTAKLNDSVVDLANQMLQSKPKLLPVVDHDNHVIGVVSRTRILKEVCARIKC